MTDDIHNGRTAIGMIINERDSRITFLYKEDTLRQRAAKRIELERVKHIQRKAHRRALEQRALDRARELGGRKIR